MNAKKRHAVTFGTGLVLIALGAAAEVDVEKMPAPVGPQPEAATFVVVPGPVEEELAFPFGPEASFDGSSLGDLAVHAPGEEVGWNDEAGAVSAFSWSAEPVDPSSGDSRQQRDPGIDSSGTGDRFGRSLAVADFGAAFDVRAAGRGSGRLVAIHPSQDLRFELASGAISVTARETSDFRVTLTYGGIGRSGGELRREEITSTQARGHRVELRRGSDLTEWYLHLHSGLEQGFTIARRPEGSGKEELLVAVDLDVEGELYPELTAGERSVVLRDAAGRDRLRYGGLAAFDAEGRWLPCRMALHGNQIQLLVDDRGARYPLVVDPLLFEHKIVGPSTDLYDHFGATVAGDASWLVVGAPYQLHSSGAGRGAAYLFARDGNAWVLDRTLTCPETDSTCAAFGASVALDGEWLVVGAPGVSGTLTVGRAHIYQLIGSSFVLNRVIAAPPSASNVLFGTSVAIDYPFLVVGTPGDDEGGTNAGAVTLYWYTSGAWAQFSKHVASDAGASDDFGRAVSISGERFVVGAPLHDTTRSDNGAVYTFTRSAVLWYEDDSVLLPSTTATNSAHFGAALSLRGDQLLVGAPDDSYINTESGRAWLYERATSGSWNPLENLYTTDDFSHFGSSVSLGSGLAAIGASGSDRAVPDAGAVYLWVDDGGWNYEGGTTAPDAHGGQLFGSSVALTPIGLIVGAEGDDEHGNEAGAVYSYLYVLFADGFESGDTDAWSQTQP